MIELPAPGGTERELWRALLDLAERRPDGWTLVGGQMVLLRALEQGRVPPRVTRDLAVRCRNPERGCNDGAMSELERLHTNQRMSQAVIHGDIIYLAGQVAADDSADVAGQTQQILAAIDRLLAEAGSDKTQILMATIWLSDIASFGAMNEVWDAWVPAGCGPARACVESRLATPAYKVEIRVVAAR